MEPTKTPEPPGFSELSVAEQIDYVLTLWERIGDNLEGIPVPDWHLEIVRERRAAYHRNPENATPGFELIDRLSREG